MAKPALPASAMASLLSGSTAPSLSMARICILHPRFKNPPTHQISPSKRGKTGVCAKLGGGEAETKRGKKKFITREEEPEQYWQTAGEREGENPMKTPLPYIIIFGMSTPFVILAIAFANGWIKVPVRLKTLKIAKPGRDLVKEVNEKFATAEKYKVSRRSLLSGSVGLHAALLFVSPAPARPLPEKADTITIPPRTMFSAVKILDIVEGTGVEAHDGDLVKLNYVCRRSNGYFVHSTIDQFSGETNPIVIPLDEKKIIKGLKEVIIGMKVGGKRRALIPPNVGYTSENLQPLPDEFGPRRSLLSHSNESLVFEVQLLKVF